MARRRALAAPSPLVSAPSVPHPPPRPPARADRPGLPLNPALAVDAHTNLVLAALAARHWGLVLLGDVRAHAASAGGARGASGARSQRLALQHGAAGGQSLHLGLRGGKPEASFATTALWGSVGGRAPAAGAPGRRTPQRKGNRTTLTHLNSRGGERAGRRGRRLLVHERGRGASWADRAWSGGGRSAAGHAWSPASMARARDVALAASAC